VYSSGTVGITTGTVIQRRSQAVPRHREVNEFLAKHILKKLAN